MTPNIITVKKLPLYEVFTSFKSEFYTLDNIPSTYLM